MAINKILGRVQPVYQGEYSASKTYSMLDRVLYNSAIYECVKDSVQNIVPTNTTYWNKLTGEQGPQGPAVPLSDSITSTDQTVAASSYAVNLLSQQIKTNTTNISTNAGNITSLQTQVATNTADIATLSGDTSITEKLTALEGRMDTADGNISTNTSNIATLKTSVSTNTSNLSALTTRVTTAEGNISTISNNLSGMLDAAGKLKQSAMPDVLQHNKGIFANASEMPTTDVQAGDYCVNTTTDTVWIYDADTSAWVDSDRKGQVTSVNGQTGEVVLDINSFVTDWGTME